MSTVRTVCLAGILVLVACSSAGPTAPTNPSPTKTTCADIDEKCRARRLPDRTLQDDERAGALESVDGFDLDGTIHFDQALNRAWEEDGHADAETVQVILGSADATKLHWGSGRRLFYAIEWGGVCAPIYGGSFQSSSRPTCVETTWGTVIDATTGAFIVGGNG